MTEFPDQDIYYMRLALEEATKAYAAGEVPVGAIIVRNGEILALTGNLRESSKDPSAHAEVLALRAAAGQSDSWRLSDATLYVTKEPCIMCSGTMINARIKRLVYGCSDAKAGGVDSLYHILSDSRLNHQVEVSSGVLAEECASLLKLFFSERR
ncbi:MAG: nucleoside deaminase [Nitrospirae bacterium]|nr:MAG: nucleoside deaminase [Nitrospirota bacterium]